MKIPNTRKDTNFLLKKSGIALTVKVGGIITQYLFVFTVARLLGPGVLGSFTLSFTVLQLLSILGLLGLDNLLTRKVAAAKAGNRPDEIKKAFLTALKITTFSSLLLSALLYFTSDLIAVQLFGKPQLAQHLRMMCFALAPFVIINIHASAFRGMKNMIGFTLFRAIIPLLNVLFILISWYASLSISPAMGYLFSSLIVLIFYVIAWRRFSADPTDTLLPESSGSWKEMVNESLPMMITGSIFFILNWIDNLVIGIYRTEAEVGIYDTAFKIAAISAVVLMAMNAIQGPTFAEFHSQNDLSKLRRSIYTSTRLLFYATLPFTLIIIVFPELILSLFGNEFISAGTALIILTIGNFFSTITGSVGILLQMTGHQRQYNIIILITAITSITMNILLVPEFGITGAAISSATAKIIQNFGGAYYVYKKFGFLSIYLPGIPRPKDIPTINQ
jgi:O-antigen/teichoic acid export membrane protein